MKNRISGICTLIIIGVLAAGCAPMSEVVIASPEATRISAEKPLDLAVGVKEFTVYEGAPEKFSTHVSFDDLVFDKKLGLQVTRAFRNHLEQTGIFRKVTLIGKKNNEDMDLVISGHVTKAVWEDTGSFLTLVLLAGVTLDIYPLLGGSLSWPEAEAEIEVTISQPSGKVLKKLKGTGKKAESLSMYSFGRATPSVQLSEALGLAFKQVARKINMNRKSFIPPPLPKVDILHPKSGRTSYTKPLIKADAISEGKSDLARYEIIVNNKTLVSSNLSGTSADIKANVSLVPGKKNPISVKVYNDDGACGKKDFVIECRPPKIKTPKRWILCIFPEAKSGSSVKIKKLLATHTEGGFSKERIELLYGKKATRANVLKTIRKSLSKVKEKGEVFIFFIGRGASGDSASEGFIVCYDTTATRIDTTALSLNKFAKTLDFNLTSGARVYGVYLFTGAPAGAKPVDAKAVQKALAQRTGWAAVCGIGKIPAAEWTKKLLKALSSASDKDWDAVLTVKEFSSGLIRAAGKNARVKTFQSGWENVKILVLEKEPE